MQDSVLLRSERTERNGRTEIPRDRPLIDPRRTRSILHRDTGGIEHDDFRRVRATLFAADDNVAELGMDIRGGEQSGADRMVEIAHDYGLGEAVHHDLRA